MTDRTLREKIEALISYDQCLKRPLAMVEASDGDGNWICRQSVLAILDAHPAQPTPDAAVEAAKVLLADDIAISRMAEAIHDGPLGADDHWFSAARPQGAWCVEVARAGLCAIAKGTRP